MQRSVSFYTYSQHRQLSSIAASLTFPTFRASRLVRSFSHKYVSGLLDIAKTDWVVHCDEDAFFLQPDAVYSIIEYMAANDYVCCGMPDGGVVKIRTHNPVSCNPFFLILNRSALYNKYKSEVDLYSSTWDPAYESYTSPMVRESGVPYEYDQYEPYYPFFSGCARTNSAYSISLEQSGTVSPRESQRFSKTSRASRSCYILGILAPFSNANKEARSLIAFLFCADSLNITFLVNTMIESCAPRNTCDCKERLRPSAN